MRGHARGARQVSGPAELGLEARNGNGESRQEIVQREALEAQVGAQRSAAAQRAREREEAVHVREGDAADAEVPRLGLVRQVVDLELPGVFCGARGPRHARTPRAGALPSASVEPQGARLRQLRLHVQRHVSQASHRVDARAWRAQTAPRRVGQLRGEDPDIHAWIRGGAFHPTPEPHATRANASSAQATHAGFERDVHPTRQLGCCGLVELHRHVGAQRATHVTQQRRERGLVRGRSSFTSSVSATAPPKPTRPVSVSRGGVAVGHVQQCQRVDVEQPVAHVQASAQQHVGQRLTVQHRPFDAQADGGLGLRIHAGLEREAASEMLVGQAVMQGQQRQTLGAHTRAAIAIHHVAGGDGERLLRHVDGALEPRVAQAARHVDVGAHALGQLRGEVTLSERRQHARGERREPQAHVHRGLEQIGLP
jgi:hypothetical protein